MTSERAQMRNTTRSESKLATETVQGPALPLESVNHIHGDDGLPAGVFGVGDGIANNRFQKDLEDVSGLFID